MHTVTHTPPPPDVYNTHTNSPSLSTPLPLPVRLPTHPPTYPPTHTHTNTHTERGKSEHCSTREWITYSKLKTENKCTQVVYTLHTMQLWISLHFQSLFPLHLNIYPIFLYNTHWISNYKVTMSQTSFSQGKVADESLNCPESGIILIKSTTSTVEFSTEI